MRNRSPWTLSCLSLLLAACAGDAVVDDVSAETRVRDVELTPQTSGTTNRLQAVSPVNRHVVWASGVGGTWAVTVDGGRTWRTGVVPGAEALQFRDVEGVSAREAYLLAAGVGTDSRIYKTEDGGATWTLQFQNEDPNGFYDCFAFWDRRRGITMADAIDGRFPVIATWDGGRSWVDIGDRLPAAQVGEAAFAASGTCVATQGARRAWIVTGGAEKSRVLLTTDGGRTWDAVEQPIIQGTATSGATSIAFRDARHGVLGGGEILAPTEPSENFARSDDGGRTWELGTPTPFTGAIYGLAYATGKTVVATGPSGAAWSRDEGDTWTLLEGVTGYWAVAFAGRTGWLVGTEGRILRIDL